MEGLVYPAGLAKVFLNSEGSVGYLDLAEVREGFFPLCENVLFLFPKMEFLKKYFLIMRILSFLLCYFNGSSSNNKRKTNLLRTYLVIILQGKRNDFYLTKEKLRFRESE